MAGDAVLKTLEMLGPLHGYGYCRLTRAGRKRVDAAAKEWALTIDILARFLSPEQSS